MEVVHASNLPLCHPSDKGRLFPLREGQDTWQGSDMHLATQFAADLVELLAQLDLRLSVAGEVSHPDRDALEPGNRRREVQARVPEGGLGRRTSEASGGLVASLEDHHMASVHGLGVLPGLFGGPGDEDLHGTSTART